MIRFILNQMSTNTDTRFLLNYFPRLLAAKYLVYIFPAKRGNYNVNEDTDNISFEHLSVPFRCYAPRNQGSRPSCFSESVLWHTGQ